VPVKFNEETRRLLDGRNAAIVATLNPDGGPQTTVVWIVRDGDFVLWAAWGFWVLRAEHTLEDEQERGVLVASPGCIPRLPGPVGEAGPFGEGVAASVAPSGSGTSPRPS
jgi:hypothetical protein